MAKRLSKRSATAEEERIRARWLSGDLQSPRWRDDGGERGGDRLWLAGGGEAGDGRDEGEEEEDEKGR